MKEDWILAQVDWLERRERELQKPLELPAVVGGSIGGRGLGQPTVAAGDVLDWEPSAMASLIEATYRPSIVKPALDESRRQALSAMRDGGHVFEDVARIRRRDAWRRVQ